HLEQQMVPQHFGLSELEGTQQSFPQVKFESQQRPPTRHTCDDLHLGSQIVGALLNKEDSELSFLFNFDVSATVIIKNARIKIKKSFFMMVIYDNFYDPYFTLIK
ncbi:5486_t:CDS:1, partial [Dentiscutata erythropus]